MKAAVVRRMLFTVLLGTPVPLRAQCPPEWTGLEGGANWEVRALATFDEDGAGPRPAALFAAGGFGTFGGIDAALISRWDGWSASPVGGGLGIMKHGVGSFHLRPLEQAIDAIERGLYVGGNINRAGDLPINNIARWDGQAWHDVGGGVESFSPNVMGYVFATCIFDEDGDGPKGPVLFAGGEFEFAGGKPAKCLARWNGSEWSPLNGLGYESPYQRPDVKAFAVYDDGRGPALYVGGSFYYADGKYAQNIARWDGQSWEQVGNDPYYGLTAEVEALAVYDEDGDGPIPPVLFAGGQFNYADGKHIPLIARWDGNEWSDVGNFQPPGSVKELMVWKGPDDERENLYAGGLFNTMPDGSPVNKIARWNGKEWRRVGQGVTGFGAGTQVSAMGAFDEDGDGPNPGGLYAGGLFYQAGGVETHHIARWGCPLGPPCDADLDKSGSLDLFDFLAFLNLFNTEDPAADCTDDGAFDLFDFLCFVNAFNAGC